MCMLNQYLFTMLLLKTYLRTKKEENYENNIFAIMSCFPEYINFDCYWVINDNIALI